MTTESVTAFCCDCGRPVFTLHRRCGYCRARHAQQPALIYEVNRAEFLRWKNKILRLELAVGALKQIVRQLQKRR